MNKNLLWALSGFVMAACATQPQATPVVSATAQSMEMHERHPTNISESASGGYAVEWCSPSGSADAGKTMTILRGDDEKAHNKMDASGCFHHSFQAGSVTPGDHLVYRLDGRNVASETVPGGISSGGSAGNYPAPSQPSTPAPAPVLDRVDLNKVQTNADNHARCTANAIVNHYGRLENFRYNYYIGFRTGLNIATDVNYGDIRNSGDYQMSMKAGQTDGYGKGQQAGQSAGQNEGSSKASQDVFKIYADVVDTGSAPVRDRQDQTPAFQGLASNLAPARTIDQRVSDFDTQYRSELGRMFVTDDDVSVADQWRTEWALTSYYNQPSYNFNLVYGLYNPDWAYDTFRARAFTRCASQADYVTKIGDGSIYSNADQAASLYQRSFKSVYRDVIDQKWNAAVSKMDPVAQQLGRNDGVQIYQGYARDLGYTNGYSISYSQGSQDTYGNAYTQSYDHSFDSEVQKYEQNSILRIEDAGAVDTTGKSRQQLVVGMPVGVQLRRVVNYGRQAGDFKVTVAGDVEQTSQKMVHIDGSATLKGSPIEASLGLVARSVQPDAQANIVINVGTAQKNDSFQNSWELLNKVFAYQPQGPTQKTQNDYIYKAISNETLTKYHSATQVSNPWGNNDRSLLLVRMVQTVQGLPGDRRANFKPIAQAMLGALGPRPGFIHQFQRGQWDSITGLLNSIK